MYKVLYRAYRPETFEEMLGQKHIVKILKHQIKEEKIHHAYLFCGTRGTGKTTTARLLAKGINCMSDGEKPCGICPNCIAIKEGTFMDLIEIDAASNNSVENIRDIRESVKYPPTMGKKKTYIIDEVHMLSNSAFNAFLKTLEEPPEYVNFILATTEPHKLPATILSRCLRLDFRRVPENELIDSMRNICSEQGVEIEEDALRIIGSNADGSARDGLTLLDQCISFGQKKVTRIDVIETLGTVDDIGFIDLTDATLVGDTSRGIMQIGEILLEGKDPRQIMTGWMNHYRNLMMVKFIKSPEKLLNMSLENIDRLKEQAMYIDIEDISLGINILAENIQVARTSSQPRILLEIAFIKLCKTDYSTLAPIKERKQEPKRVDTISIEDTTSPNETISPKNTISPEEPFFPELEGYVEIQEENENNSGRNLSLEELIARDKAKLENNNQQNSSLENKNDIKTTYNLKSVKDKNINESIYNKSNKISSDKLNNEENKIINVNEETLKTDNTGGKSFGLNTEKESVALNSEEEEKYNIDLERLWNRIVEDGSKEQPSFTILNFGAKLIEINDEAFVINAGVGASTYLNQYQSKVEELFKKHAGFGRRMKMGELKTDSDKEKKSKLKDIENALGIKIDK